MYSLNFGQDFDGFELDDLRTQAATALLRAAEDGRLASALAPKELEQMRQEAADALLRAAKDGSLEKALLKARESYGHNGGIKIKEEQGQTEFRSFT